MNWRSAFPSVRQAERVEEARATAESAVAQLREDIEIELAALRHLTGTGFASTSGQTGEQAIVDNVAATLLKDDR